MNVYGTSITYVLTFGAWSCRSPFASGGSTVLVRCCWSPKTTPKRRCCSSPTPSLYCVCVKHNREAWLYFYCGLGMQ